MVGLARMTVPPLEELRLSVAKKASELVSEYESLESDNSLNARLQRLIIENRLIELRDTMAGRICPLTDKNVRRLISWLSALN